MVNIISHNQTSTCTSKKPCMVFVILSVTY